MTRHVSAYELAQVVEKAIPQLACALPADILSGLRKARDTEVKGRACVVLDQLIENAEIARTEQVPLCQDTGTVWVALEIGAAIEIGGDVFSQINHAVACAYEQADLRKSLVVNALFDRRNTGDNTPAFCEIIFSDNPEMCRVHIMIKGGGSDNASRIVMLNPSAGRRGIIDEVIRCVQEKAANACPPLVIGLGIGATFDKVAGLAKYALLRPLDEPAPTSELAAFEQECLEAVNATGIGPAGLGGNTCALGVRVKTAPCHIAALPLAINMGCSAMRRCTIEL